MGLIFALFIFHTPAHAMVSPLGLSIAPPLQFPGDSFDIAGARLNVLWGNHSSVYGFDLGAVGNYTRTNMVGVQAAGIFNYNAGAMTAIGLQVSGIANINVNKAHVVGVQAALFNGNYAESSVVGLQVGVINNAQFTDITGFQVGLFNKAATVRGFQIGLINMAKALHGLQIGLANFNSTGLFTVAPFLNVGF